MARILSKLPVCWHPFPVIDQKDVMDQEHVMEGVIDLSFEAFNNLDNLPSAVGRG